MSTAQTEPFRFFDLTVLRTERLGPSLVRVVFTGDELDAFASGGYDQSLSVFLPHPGQEAPVVPRGADWFEEFRAMDPRVRAVCRSYTVRAQRPGEVDIDFVLHASAAGPAATWAAQASPGDRIAVIGPAVADNAGVRFRRPEEAAWVLIAADETALPAAAGILERLPAGLSARVWLRVPEEADRLELRTAAKAEITWLDSGLEEAIASAELPQGEPYVWIAGESAMVRTVRRHLVGERGIDRRAVTFTGYWRRGATEDQYRLEGDGE
ncbi:siderophore-interacting protein [Streptomyces polyrhachis]|uniref:Siderophore-interacting protein n=1 Tax=Streptomyces polyrhachis TaxID=1282885 RepID=A0ABW2GMY3_9ACTN